MKTQLKATKTLSLCHQRAGVSNIWILDLKWTSLAPSQWGEVFTWNLMSKSLQRERQARLHIVTIPVNHYSNFTTFVNFEIRLVIFHCFDYLKLPSGIDLLLKNISCSCLGLDFVWYLNFSQRNTISRSGKFFSSFFFFQKSKFKITNLFRKLLETKASSSS